MVIFEADILKLARAVESVDIGDIGVNPKLRCGRKGAIFGGFIVAGDVFFDAVDLIFVNVGVVGNKSELAGVNTDTLRN